MKEILESKSIIAFFIIMICITFIATPTNKLESENTEYVYANIK